MEPAAVALATAPIILLDLTHPCHSERVPVCISPQPTLHSFPQPCNGSNFPLGDRTSISRFAGLPERVLVGPFQTLQPSVSALENEEDSKVPQAA